MTVSTVTIGVVPCGEGLANLHVILWVFLRDVCVCVNLPVSGSLVAGCTRALFSYEGKPYCGLTPVLFHVLSSNPRVMLLGGGPRGRGGWCPELSPSPCLCLPTSPHR